MRKAGQYPQATPRFAERRKLYRLLQCHSPKAIDNFAGFRRLLPQTIGDLLCETMNAVAEPAPASLMPRGTAGAANSGMEKKRAAPAKAARRLTRPMRCTTNWAKTQKPHDLDSTEEPNPVGAGSWLRRLDSVCSPCIGGLVAGPGRPCPQPFSPAGVRRHYPQFSGRHPLGPCHARSVWPVHGFAGVGG